MDDDQRRYWSPGGLFAEKLADYARRPHRSRRSRLMVMGGLVLVAIPVAVGVAFFTMSVIGLLT